MQISAMSRCRCVGAAMVTASTPRSGEQRLDALDCRAAQCARNELTLGAVGVSHADQLHAGQIPASTRAWLLPITPAPITPTRNARFTSVFAPDADPFETHVVDPNRLFGSNVPAVL